MARGLYAKRVYIAGRAPTRATEWSARGHGGGGRGVQYSVCGCSRSSARSHTLGLDLTGAQFNCEQHGAVGKATRREPSTWDSPHGQRRRSRFGRKNPTFSVEAVSNVPGDLRLPAPELSSSQPLWTASTVNPQPSLSPAAKLSKYRQAAATPGQNSPLSVAWWERFSDHFSAGSVAPARP